MEATITLTSNLKQAKVFERVTPDIYQQLLSALRDCLVNSTALLSLEQRIKAIVAEKQANQYIFLTLCAIFLTHTTEPQL